MEDYEFDEAALAKVKEFESSLETVQADIIKYSIKKQEPVFKQRDAFLADVEKFWFKALQNCIPVSMYIDDEDRVALQSLNNVRVERNLEDPREATIHFDFDENEYFSNKTLTKAFKVLEGAEPLGSDEFEFSESVSTEKVKIDWKSDEKNLAKKSPVVQPPGINGDDADDDEQLDPGSFFSSFFEDDKTYAVSIGDNLINEFYPRAIDYYRGTVEDDLDMYEDEDDEDEEDFSEDEEDEEDDDREIDLEEEEAQREAKKAKK